MAIDLSLTISRRAPYATLEPWERDGYSVDESQVISPGAKVEYVSHCAGGMVKCLHNGRLVVIHPGCTAELA